MAVIVEKKVVFSEKEKNAIIGKLDLGFSIFAEERKSLVGRALTSKREISCFLTSTDAAYEGLYTSGLTYNDVFDQMMVKIWDIFIESEAGKKLIADTEKQIAEREKKKAEKEAKKAEKAKANA